MCVPCRHAGAVLCFRWNLLRVQNLITYVWGVRSVCSMLSCRCCVVLQVYFAGAIASMTTLLGFMLLRTSIEELCEGYTTVCSCCTRPRNSHPPLFFLFFFTNCSGCQRTIRAGRNLSCFFVTDWCCCLLPKNSDLALSYGLLLSSEIMWV